MGTLASCVSLFVEKYCVGGKRAKAVELLCYSYSFMELVGKKFKVFNGGGGGFFIMGETAFPASFLSTDAILHWLDYQNGRGMILEDLKKI